MIDTTIYVSVIIINHNTRDLLRDCLYSIYQNCEEMAIEVIVVDNNSTDGSLDMLEQKFQSAKIIPNNINRGFAKACNQGIKLSKGEYILLLNSDTVVLSDTFMKLHTFMENRDLNEHIGIIGCKILNPDRTLQYSAGKFPTIFSTIKDRFLPPHKRKYLLTGYDEPHEVDWVTGACMLIDRRVFQDIGLMDENYFMYYEEVDLCHQAKKNGWKVFYYPEPCIIHENPYALNQDNASEKVLTEIRRSHLYYFRKNRGYLSFIFLFFMSMTLLSLKLIYYYAAFFLEKAQRESNIRKSKQLVSVVFNTFFRLNKKTYSLII